MAYCCCHCGKPLQLIAGQRIGRSESCPSCRGDMHCCKNCSYYDEKAYNQCREPQAERVLEKDRSNYCDYFSFREGGATAAASPKEKALQDLDALFKK